MKLLIRPGAACARQDAERAAKIKARRASIYRYYQNIERILAAVLAALEEFGDKREARANESAVADPMADPNKRPIGGVKMPLYKVRISKIMDGDLFILLGMSRSWKGEECDRGKKWKKTSAAGVFRCLEHGY